MLQTRRREGVFVMSDGIILMRGTKALKVGNHDMRLPISQPYKSYLPRYKREEFNRERDIIFFPSIKHHGLNITYLHSKYSQDCSS